MGDAGDVTFDEVMKMCASDEPCEYARWGISRGLLIASPPTCCGGEMYITVRRGATDGCAYRCRVCKREKSIRHGSWTKGSHFPLSDLCMLLAYWIKDQSIWIASEYCHMSELKVIEYYGKFRDAAEDLYYGDLGSNPLGGTNVICETDETVYRRAKYHRGRGLRRPPYWTFGAIDTITNRVMAEHVETRDEDTLVPIIASVVREGSKIWSDCWRAYGALPEHGFDNATVNHSENFVDPETQVNTQLIECTWSAIKSFLRKRNCRSREYVMQHVHEWCFRRNLGDTFSECWKFINNHMNYMNS